MYWEVKEGSEACTIRCCQKKTIGIARIDSVGICLWNRAKRKTLSKKAWTTSTLTLIVFSNLTCVTDAKKTWFKSKFRQKWRLKFKIYSKNRPSSLNTKKRLQNKLSKQIKSWMNSTSESKSMMTRKVPKIQTIQCLTEKSKTLESNRPSRELQSKNWSKKNVEPIKYFLSKDSKKKRPRGMKKLPKKNEIDWNSSKKRQRKNEKEELQRSLNSIDLRSTVTMHWSSGQSMLLKKQSNSFQRVLMLNLTNLHRNTDGRDFQSDSSFFFTHLWRKQKPCQHKCINSWVWSLLASSEFHLISS